MLMDSKLAVYNIRGEPLNLLFDENKKPAQAQFDKFGRLLYQIFDKNGDLVYSESGEELHALYDENGHPNCVVFDNQGQEVTNGFDKNGNHETALFDKNGIPIYDNEGNLWSETNEIVEDLGKSKQRRRRRREQYLTQQDKKELKNEMEELRKQMNRALKIAEVLPKSSEDLMKDHLLSALNVFLNEKNTNNLGSKTITAQLKADLKAILDSAIKSYIIEHDTLSDSSDVERAIADILREELDRTLENSSRRTSIENSKNVKSNTSCHLEMVEELVCQVLKIYGMAEENNDTPFEQEISRALVLLVRLLENLIDATHDLKRDQDNLYNFILKKYKQFENLIAEVYEDLDEQFDKIEYLEHLTNSNEIPIFEANKNLIDNEITCIKSQIIALKKAIEYVKEKVLEKVQRTDFENTIDNLEKIFKGSDLKTERSLLHLLKSVKENQNNIILKYKTQSMSIADKLKTISDATEQKADASYVEKSVNCLAKSVQSIEHYINKYVAGQEPYKLSGGRSLLGLECNCVCCGRHGVMNNELPSNLPELKICVVKNVCKKKEKQ